MHWKDFMHWKDLTRITHELTKRVRFRCDLMAIIITQLSLFFHLNSPYATACYIINMVHYKWADTSFIYALRGSDLNYSWIDETGTVSLRVGRYYNRQIIIVFPLKQTVRHDVLFNESVFLHVGRYVLYLCTERIWLELLMNWRNGHGFIASSSLL